MQVICSAFPTPPLQQVAHVHDKAIGPRRDVHPPPGMEDLRGTRGLRM